MDIKDNTNGIRTNSNMISGMMSKAQNTNAIVNQMESIEKYVIKVDNNMQSFDAKVSTVMPSIDKNTQAILNTESSIR